MASFAQSEAKSQASSAGGATQAWRPQQLQLLEWFQREAPTLAEPYTSAVRLFGDMTFPARVYLVCHIVRDIYNKLPEILDGDYRRKEPGMVYPAAIEEMVKPWEPYLGTSETLPGPDAVANTTVSADAVLSVRELLRLRREIKAQPPSAEALLRALYRRSVEAGQEPSPWLKESFKKAHRWFTERAHLRRGEPPTDEGLAERFYAFEQTLHSLIAPYFDVQQDIDADVQQANQTAG